MSMDAPTATPSADIARVLDQLLAQAGSTDLDVALIATAHISATIGEAQSYERFAVTQLRQNGTTWAQIAHSLNVTPPIGTRTVQQGDRLRPPRRP